MVQIAVRSAEIIDNHLWGLGIVWFHWLLPSTDLTKRNYFHIIQRCFCGGESFSVPSYIFTWILMMVTLVSWNWISFEFLTYYLFLRKKKSWKDWTICENEIMLKIVPPLWYFWHLIAVWWDFRSCALVTKFQKLCSIHCHVKIRNRPIPEMPFWVFLKLSMEHEKASMCYMLSEQK